MRIVQKIWLLIGLGIVFTIALWLLRDMIHERSPLLANTTLGGLSEYRVVLRCAKYGLLFIILTFGVFFLFEVLHDLRIHPMQYLLVGAALCLFYMLLLSFTEVIGFETAYLIAAVACVGLITWYVRYVLRTDRRAIVMGALLSVGYVTMFILLQTEKYTLVIGSVLLFVALATVMYITRHVDWYALQENIKTNNNEKIADSPHVGNTS